jgi:hypothetical protein
MVFLVAFGVVVAIALDLVSCRGRLLLRFLTQLACVSLPPMRALLLEKNEIGYRGAWVHKDIRL